MKRASANAAAMPTTTPTSASRIPWLTTIVRTCPVSRAQRQPDADLLRALLDRVRDQSVDADRGQRQRRQAEDRHQPHVEPLARGRARDDVGHRADVGHRQAGGLSQRLLNLAAQARRARRPFGRPTPSA